MQNPGLLVLGWGLGSFIGAYLYHRPKISKIIKYDEKNRKAIFKIISEETYQKKYNFYNLDCLSKKGYDTKLSFFKNKLTITNKKIEENKFIEQLEKDCRECNLYMEFKYKYLTIFTNSKKITKNIYWHDYLEKANYESI